MVTLVGHEKTAGFEPTSAIFRQLAPTLEAKSATFQPTLFSSRPTPAIFNYRPLIGHYRSNTDRFRLSSIFWTRLFILLLNRFSDSDLKFKNSDYCKAYQADLISLIQMIIRVKYKKLTIFFIFCFA